MVPQILNPVHSTSCKFTHIFCRYPDGVCVRAQAHVCDYVQMCGEIHCTPIKSLQAKMLTSSYRNSCFKPNSSQGGLLWPWTSQLQGLNLSTNSAIVIFPASPYSRNQTSTSPSLTLAFPYPNIVLLYTSLFLTMLAICSGNSL